MRFLRVRHFCRLSVFVIPIVSTVVLCSLGLLAQSPTYQYATGMPPFSTPSPAPVTNGFVDLATGNLHLEIPIRSYAQRGGAQLSYKMVYDSRIWQVVNNGSSLTWQPTNVANSQGGWRVVSSLDPGAVTYTYTTTACGPTQQLQTWSSFTWTDPVGTSHVFPITTSQNPCTQQNTPSGDALAQDSSGFHMWITNYTTAVVRDRSGNQLFPNFEDTNGNFLSTDGNGNIVDTLGRTPVVKTVNGNITYLDVLNSSGSTSRYTITYSTINVDTNFGQSGVTEYSGSFQAVTSIGLPDGSSYSFAYDSGTTPGSFGLVNSVTLRQGGSQTFAWTSFADSYGNINRWVSSMTNHNNSGSATWTFTPAVITTCGSGQTGCQQKLTYVTPANDNRVYTFILNNGAWNTQTQTYSGSTTLLKTETATFDFSNSCPTGCLGAGYIRPTQTTLVVPIPAGSLTAQTKYSYDSIQNGNVAALQEWNFFSGSPGANPDRETDTTYLNTSAYVSANILNRPASVLIKNSGSTQLSLINYSYDGGSLTAVTGVAHHDDTNYGATQTVRGNPTTIQKWVSGSTYLTTTIAYDTTGQVLSTTFPDNVTRSYSYADSYYNDNGASPPASYTPAAPTNAFVTKITLTSIGQSPFLQYSYYYGSGKRAIFKDAMLVPSYLHYSDSLDRQTLFFGPAVGSGNEWTLTSYPAANETDTYTGITSTTPASSCTSCIHKATYLEQLGRLYQNVLENDPSGETIVTVNHGPTGRISSVSNPYRSTSDPTYGLQQYSYDGADRVVSVVRQDGTNTVTNSYGNSVGSATQFCAVATYGNGYPVLNSDEAGKKKIRWYDAFGRLIEVDEPNSNGVLNVNTCYQYDALGNVLKIVQGAQTRTRVYDGLSRATSVNEPESGTTTYSYSPGFPCSAIEANPCSKTDSRTIKTTYAYDSIDRLYQITFSDTTPTITYHYDQTSFNGLTISYGGLRLTGMSDASGQTAWSYDAGGHVITERRTIGTVTKNTSYTYNLDGSAAAVTYPNGHTINYSYSNAQRELSAVDTVNNVNFALNGTYAPQGKLASAVYGQRTGFAGISRTRAYNNRLQTTSIVDTAPGGTIQNYSYSYDLGSGVNNGNVASITDALDNEANQFFSYDNLNRISAGWTQATTGGDAWGQSFTIDQYGNLSNVTVTQGTAYSLSVTINPATNQITSSGYTYDAAGNLKTDGTNTYTWNALNQLISVAGVTYTYDGHGKRVEKSSGELDWFAINGDLLAETDTAGNLLHEYVYFGGRAIARRDGSGSVYYYFTDRLHSSRHVTDSSGNVQQASVYLPFGGEHVLTSFDDRKFTLKRRDSESAVDYAYARMYHPILGRWLSTDAGHMLASNPQTLNRYAYVVGNPGNYTDTTGHFMDDDEGMGGDIRDDGGGGGGGDSNSGSNTTKGPGEGGWWSTQGLSGLDMQLLNAFGWNNSALNKIVSNPEGKYYQSVLTGWQNLQNSGNESPGGANPTSVSASSGGHSHPLVSLDPPLFTDASVPTYNCACEAINWDPVLGGCGMSCTCNDDYQERVAAFSIKGLRQPPCNAGRVCPVSMQATKVITVIDTPFGPLSWGTYTPQSCVNYPR